VGVAERGDVDAEQLELGGHVGAGEGAVAPEERVHHDLGHRVAGRDQAVHHAARCRALADREDVLVAGAAVLVDEDAAALGDGQLGGAAERVLGTDAGREDDDVDVEGLAVLERQTGRPARPVRAEDGLGHRAGVHGEAEALDVPGEGAAAGRVDLDRHQPGRQLDDVGLQTELAQGVGRLQAQQSAADHGTGPRPPGRLPDRLEVLDGAVDEDVLEIAARDRRDERVGARRQHQLVVVQVLAGVERDDPLPRADRDDLGARAEADPRVVVPPLRQQAQRLRADLEEAGQRDPVVRRPGLRAEHGDVVGLGETALDRGLDEPVSDHAVSDDHQLLASVRRLLLRHG